MSLAQVLLLTSMSVRHAIILALLVLDQEKLSVLPLLDVLAIGSGML